MSAAAVPPAATRAADVARRVLGADAVAIWLYGSCLAGGLRPQSDVDVLVFVETPLDGGTRQALVAALLASSGWHAPGADPRPLDVTLVCRGEVLPWRHPARCELQFGEWLRGDLAAGRIAAPAPRADLAIQLTSVRQASMPLHGPPAETLLPAVPPADLRRAHLACLPELLANLHGDERNVLLTLARMAFTLATDRITTKDGAARWASARLPAPLAETMVLAGAAYLGERRDDWASAGDAADALAAHLAREIRAA